MKKIITLLFLLVISLSINNSIFAQANSVGLNGSFTFNSIASAYAAIGAVGSPQLIELSATYTGADEVAPISLTPKAGVSSVNTITIRPSAGANGLVLSKLQAANYIFRFDACTFVILDGRPGGVVSTPSNYLTVTNTGVGAAAGAAAFFAAENCNVQYINANGVPSATGCRTINVAGGATLPSKNITVQNNVVRGGARGIQDFGTTLPISNTNDVIINNDIAQFFSIGILSANNTGVLFAGNRVHSTSAISHTGSVVAIQIQSVNTTVDGNKVDSVTTSVSLGTGTFSAMVFSTSTNCIAQNNTITNINWPFANSLFNVLDFGINTTFKNNTISNLSTLGSVISGFQGSGTGTASIEGNTFANFTNSTVFLIGINLASNGTGISNYTVKNNKISNFTSNNTLQVDGIRVAPFRGSTVHINNNFISNTGSNNGAFVDGIILNGSGAPDTLNYTANVYYNSVNIGGSATNQPPNSVNSVGIYKTNESPTAVFNIKNNISMNRRVNGDTSKSLQLGGWVDNIAGTLNIDYNTYKSTDTTYGYDAAWIDTLYRNAGITGYQAYASPNEANSNFHLVNFVSNTDLHLAGSSIGDPLLIGTPIAGVTTDIDNQTRSAVKPYRGADESTTGLSTLTLTINFEAYPTTDTITVQLRNATLPYAVVEQVKGLGGADTPQPIHFANAVDGVPYYVVVKYRNGIETWSSGTPVFTNHSASYDFTTALSQAFGSNMKLVGGIPSIFQGDVNQSGNVNLADVLLVTNDATNFITGPYLNTDFNGSGTVNLADILIAANNNTNFVVVKKPAGATPNPGPIVNDNVTVTSNSNTSIPVSGLNIRTAEQVGNTVLMER